MLFSFNCSKLWDKRKSIEFDMHICNELILIT